jgi:dTDP-glucose pyrophosphorylase
MFLMGGTNIAKNKEDYPLYLTEIEDKLILEKQINYGMALSPRQFLFCVKMNDIKSFRVDAVIKQITSDSVIIPIESVTKGAICSALLGVEHIDNDEELVLMAVDDFIEDPGLHILDYFHERGSDCGVVSFSSVHPRYSFVRVGHEHNVIEVAEKRPISKNALVSFYYFKKGGDFVACAKETIRKDNPVNGAFYISQAINEMILKQKKVSMYSIPSDKFHPLKTEAQLAEYLFEFRERSNSK